VNRQKKVERKERGHDKIILPPSGISRQWPFPALTNSLRDSTETISTIAHTQLRPSGVLSCTRISSTDFLLFPSSPPSLSLSLSLSSYLARARTLATTVTIIGRGELPRHPCAATSGRRCDNAEEREKVLARARASCNPPAHDAGTLLPLPTRLSH